MLFDGGSAGSATITAYGGAVSGANGAQIEFANGGHAGSATLLAASGVSGAAGGRVQFFTGATGDTARLIVEQGALATFGNNNHETYGIGSIEGAGDINLGNSQLTVGGLDLSTTLGRPDAQQESAARSPRSALEGLRSMEQTPTPG